VKSSPKLIVGARISLRRCLRRFGEGRRRASRHLTSPRRRRLIQARPGGCALTARGSGSGGGCGDGGRFALRMQKLAIVTVEDRGSMAPTAYEKHFAVKQLIQQTTKLCGLWWGRHNMPPPPASGDLNSHSELSAWRSPRMSVRGSSCSMLTPTQSQKYER